MPKVYHRRDPDIPSDAVYVGRPSKWGNPYTHLSTKTLADRDVATRQEAVDAYRDYLVNERPDLMAALHELKGRDLVCWCAPQACHGDVLLELSNQIEQTPGTSPQAQASTEGPTPVTNETGTPHLPPLEWYDGEGTRASLTGSRLVIDGIPGFVQGNNRRRVTLGLSLPLRDPASRREWTDRTGTRAVLTEDGYLALIGAPHFYGEGDRVALTIDVPDELVAALAAAPENTFARAAPEPVTPTPEPTAPAPVIEPARQTTTLEQGGSMSERQATTGQLRLIRDLHVDRTLAGISAEEAAPILQRAGLVTPERLVAAGIADDKGQLFITRFSQRTNQEMTWHVRDGRRLALDVSKAANDQAVSRAAYARLADQLNVEFTPPTSYEAADRQITRLKSMLNEPGRVSGRDREALAEDVDLEQQLARSVERDGSYAPDTVENTPSTPESEQAGASASWGAGYQMSQQSGESRASVKQVQLLRSVAEMAGVEVTAAKTSRDVSRQIDGIVAAMTTRIHEIQSFLQIELTDTSEMKPWDLGRLLTDSKVAAMNELRTLEQMAGITQPTTPTSWAAARETIQELRDKSGIVFSLRADREQYMPFFGGHEPDAFYTDVPLPTGGYERVQVLGAVNHSFARTYAGIGSRRTPQPALTAMRATAENLSAKGYTMRSGHAPGADTAFEVASQNAEIYLPWSSFEKDRPVIGSYKQDQASDQAMQLASRIHPAWERLDRGPRALHARNMHQILGRDLQSPVDFVVCYTPDGSLTGHGPDTGGTATALRLAYRNNIPVLNIKRPEHAGELAAYLQDNVPERRLQHCRGWVEHHLPATDPQLAELLDLHVDEQLSRMLPSQALAAISKTPLREIADATAEFPFQYDERGHQIGTGLDLMHWYANQPGANVAHDTTYDQLADHWGINVSTPDTAELTRIKIAQMREKLWDLPSLASAVEAGID